MENNCKSNRRQNKGERYIFYKMNYLAMQYSHNKF